MKAQDAQIIFEHFVPFRGFNGSKFATVASPGLLLH
jgi:hypothetical protein